MAQAPRRVNSRRHLECSICSREEYQHTEWTNHSFQARTPAELEELHLAETTWDSADGTKTAVLCEDDRAELGWRVLGIRRSIDSGTCELCKRSE